MPFAGYADFPACVRQNQQAKDPDAYCASIKRAVEGKSEGYQQVFLRALAGEDTDWLDTKDWHNNRTHAAFINDALTDFEGDRVTLDAQVLAMPHYAEEGFLEWMHGRDPREPKGPPKKIGRPIGWRVQDGKVEVRWGVYDRDDMMGLAEIDQKWAEIQKGGTFSMTFVPVTQYIVEEGGRQVREISLVHLQSVGFVGPWAASPGAVSTGKASMIIMKALDPSDVSRETDYARKVKALLALGVDVDKGMETLKSGSGYARPEFRLELSEMATDDDAMKKAAEEAVKAATAKAKEKEAKEATKAAAKKKEAEEKAAAKAAQEKAEHDPPKCEEGMHWDADAGECVPDEAPTAEESLKALQKEVGEQRTLLMRLLKQGLPDPAQAAKAFRAEVEKALEADDITPEIRTLLEGILAKVAPVEPEDLDKRVERMVQDLVGAKMTEVKEAQTKAVDEIETELREKVLPVRKRQGKPDTSGGTGAMSAEKVAEGLMGKADEVTKKRRETPGFSRW